MGDLQLIMNSTIKITGAQIHNLKNIDMKIPKGKLTVLFRGSTTSSLVTHSQLDKRRGFDYGF